MLKLFKMCVFAMVVIFRVDAVLLKNVVHDVSSTRTGPSPSTASSGIVNSSTSAVVVVVESALGAPEISGKVAARISLNTLSPGT
jgi:hypothetical protein